ncbi:hypothetical protein IKE99_00290 [Candidatus Saccharibacteria bacterium]|nr:hypothetical protein [Candidatus Saccharibacteria bacterium]
MLKIVIFDSGYGGEFLADRFEEEIYVVDIIRVIDWRHADIYLNKPKTSRKYALEALRPYIGKVDLIIIANQLLSATSLKYFSRTFPEQRFIGLELKTPDTFIDRGTIILTTKALTKTMEYHGFIFRLKRRVETITVDSWLEKIDNGDLSPTEINQTLTRFCFEHRISPQEVILGCSQLEDIRSELKKIFGRNLKIYSSFDDTIRKACKILRIRGGIGRKS